MGNLRNSRHVKKLQLRGDNDDPSSKYAAQVQRRNLKTPKRNAPFYGNLMVYKQIVVQFHAKCECGGGKKKEEKKKKKKSNCCPSSQSMVSPNKTDV